jgi:hypothetical protein
MEWREGGKSGEGEKEDLEETNCKLGQTRLLHKIVKQF